MGIRNVIWVKPDGAGGWDVKMERTRKAAANFASKIEAVDHALTLAQRKAVGQVRVQDLTGKLQRELRTGTPDPRPGRTGPEKKRRARRAP